MLALNLFVIMFKEKNVSVNRNDKLKKIIPKVELHFSKNKIKCSIILIFPGFDFYCTEFKH